MFDHTLDITLYLSIICNAIMRILEKLVNDISDNIHTYI